MQILESSFYQNQNVSSARTWVISYRTENSSRVSPKCPTAYSSFLEDVTGRDSPWSKKQPSGRLSPVCPAGDWRKLECRPPSPGQLWTAEVYLMQC